ncbi:MAG: class I SAM-dependent DNA methyltransferase [Quinella sp. 1Q5]|nr:class I SAM-dependent DNA methyltransferase [Quinella sp. 1Q5]
MTKEQQVNAAKEFAFYWNNKGAEISEISDYQTFWWQMLRKVFGVDEPEEFINMQAPVHFEKSTGHIDILIPRTKVLIEQKTFGTNLNKADRKYFGELLTPFEQAKRYADALPDDKKPRWIITCNFSEFHIYDLKEMDSLEYILGEKIYKPIILKLENFHNDYAQLQFITDPNAIINPEVKISIDAAKIVRKICFAIDKQYTEKNDDYINTLSKFCARLVFCFYADDANLFTQSKFTDYLKEFPSNQLNDELQKFFAALNTPKDKRADLEKFPYVDGGLFEEKLNLPPLNQRFKHEIEYAHILRTDAGNFRLDELNNFIKFSWREINPTIFGAMFESVFNDDTRRDNGIYYTSIENIHKVIDPLFMNDLNNEFELARRKQIKNRPKALRDLQDKIASLNFLDPACGSGNFLTETYLSLRELENKILAELRSIYADNERDTIKVSPRQFYGIEINAFAVSIAKLALSIAENQMRRKSAWILNRRWDDLPLTKYISVRQANALSLDWAEVVLPANIDYIIGNPPFHGARKKSDEQADDVNRVFAGWRNVGNLDYVACWYKKAADFMTGNQIRAALVSTNSLCQGDSVGTLWKRLFAEGVHIDFAHRTFKWLSDSENQAHVHCIVVGFSCATNDKPKLLIDGNKVTVAENINAYLVDGENIFVESRPNHIQNGVPKMQFGNQPIDDGNYRFTPEEMDDFIRAEPAAAKYFRPWFGAEEFIKGKRRYCLLLKDLPLEEIKAMPLCWERVEAVRRYRLSRKRSSTRKLADKPTRFQVENFPSKRYLAVPQTSSERRQYIPIGFISNSNIASEKILIVPDATFYHFGVLTSSIHMAWTRATCGRLESRYSYSIGVVYNNFYWASPSGRQRRRIEETAQEILKVRALFPDWTYAALYNEETMPADLRDAHRENDLAVAIAYGFADIINDEAAIVAKLMKEYKRLTS